MVLAIYGQLSKKMVSFKGEMVELKGFCSQEERGNRGNGKQKGNKKKSSFGVKTKTARCGYITCTLSVGPTL